MTPAACSRQKVDPRPHTPALSVVRSLPLELPGDLRTRLKQRLDSLGYRTEVKTLTVDHVPQQLPPHETKYDQSGFKVPRHEHVTSASTHKHSLKHHCSLITVSW